MAKMNANLTRKHEAAKARLSAARDAVFAAAPNNTTPFGRCYEMASAEVRAEHDNAGTALAMFEAGMVREGRGWFGTHGVFYGN